MPKKHIETVCQELTTLMKDRRYVLSMLHAQGRYGWEKWLQVELAYRLSALGAPEFEVMYKYDQRVSKPKGKAKFSYPFIDLQFRAKSHLKDRFTAIEIKVSETEKGLGSLLSDFMKIRAIGSGKWRFRSVIGILAYGRDKGSKNTKFKDLLSALQEKGGAGKLVEGADYNFFVIGWEKGLTENMTHEAYNEWFKKLRATYKEKGVTRKRARRRD